MQRDLLVRDGVNKQIIIWGEWAVRGEAEFMDVEVRWLQVGEGTVWGGEDRARVGAVFEGLGGGGLGVEVAGIGGFDGGRGVGGGHCWVVGLA